MAESNDIGARIQALRTARGMSREELARRVDRSVAAVGHWETGERRPPLKHLPVIAAALGVEMEVRLVPKATELDDHAAQVLLQLADILPRVPEERRGSLVAQINDLAERYPAAKDPTS